ncbi:uncharacterized protein PITG_15617 [Phytophthora infestans T30-4]|uniref:Uncharacterized protein n=2 Tax=Phytophthora infestans TaxID=4787 RepID=D0NT69_PHYIT|nr:uncharacterized protein PITG_15617 [Phytophthora infestans T30-4]EEY64825.1 conserved hypothetical protein [Phytophthora infestans T30-4]KAF4028233.1 hypothetical protein GN244_ATG20098 [Phytophthora infestans]KAF4143957.1 hypothetical protein GN958_ATG06852 [Phytophthora infestans]|eukprot:XP_002897752.1 conserved hypothetical protein [Phytophthora infestans T30-4]
MELFAGFNAEELAMMQELLRLLLEDDDVLTQQPTPRTSVRQGSQALFDGLAGGMVVNSIGDCQWGEGVPNGMAWNAPPAMMAPTPQYAVKTSRIRTRSSFESEGEPMLKRGRVDIAPTMRTQVSYIPVPDGSRAGYSYY